MARPLPPMMTARLAVLAIATSTASALLGLGIGPLTTAWTTLVGTAGAVEVSCRLTGSTPAPKVRITVVVVIMVFFVRLLAAGFPPAPTLMLILAASTALAEISRRLTGLPYRLPRLT